MVYAPELAVILRISDTTPTEKIFTLQKNSGPLKFSAGQFIQVSVPGYGEAPFSVCSSPERTEEFDICVRATGNVSDALHRLSPGDSIGIRGPYGRHFPTQKMQHKDILCIAGGVGLACLRPLISHIRYHRDNFARLTVIHGAKTPGALLFKKDLEEWQSDENMELYQIVDEPDENWQGPVGVITDPLKTLAVRADQTIAAVVGPPVVFRFTAQELLHKKVPEDRIYFSLERRFQCGIGKCGHCQLNDVYICQDGPVFSYAELTGRSEATEACLPE